MSPGGHLVLHNQSYFNSIRHDNVLVQKSGSVIVPVEKKRTQATETAKAKAQQR